jgi:hypothetical protein
MLCRPVPSALTTQSQREGKRENTILVPSGDQLGLESIVCGASVSRRRPDPSALTTAIWV